MNMIYFKVERVSNPRYEQFVGQRFAFGVSSDDIDMPAEGASIYAHDSRCTMVGKTENRKPGVPYYATPSSLWVNWLDRRGLLYPHGHASAPAAAPCTGDCTSAPAAQGAGASIADHPGWPPVAAPAAPTVDDEDSPLFKAGWNKALQRVMVFSQAPLGGWTDDKITCRALENYLTSIRKT